MGIGTSTGQYYDDDFEHARAQWNPETYAPPPSGGGLGSPTEPAGALKSSEGTEVAPLENSSLRGSVDVPSTPLKKVYITGEHSSGNNYDTPLTSDEQAAYSQRFGTDANRDYDMQGYFKNNPEVQPNQEGVHYPDTFKKPNHMTFSDESIYHGGENLGGHWGTDSEGKDTFTPGPTNLKNHTMQELRDYFQKVEPNAKLLPPDINDVPHHDWIESLGKGIAQSIYSGITAPGDALAGKLDPNTPEGVRRSLDLAGAIGLSPAGAGSKATLGSGGNYDDIHSILSALEEHMASQQPTKLAETHLGGGIPFGPPGDVANMGAAEAADHFHQLFNDEGGMAAIKFAHEFEDKAHPKTFNLYAKMVNDAHYYQNSKAFPKDPLEQVPFNPQAWQPKSKEFDYGENSETFKAMKQIEEILKSQDNPLYKESTQSLQTVKQALEANPKLSPKEAFIRGAQAVHDELKSTFANIKSKYVNTVAGDLDKKLTPKVEPKGEYSEPAYRGITLYGNKGESPNPVFDFEKGNPNHFSSNSPMLADMYAGYLSHHPGYEIPPGKFPPGAQVLPLLLNTRNYHVFDAKGKLWTQVQDHAIQEAKKEGKHGVIMDNVWDEPNSTTNLPGPKKVYITFPEGAHTVKSRFAEKFDPTSPNILHNASGIGMGTSALGYVTQDQPE